MYGTAPHPFPFAHGAVVTTPEKLVILAGQVGFDRFGADRLLVGEDAATQARQAFENIKKLLTETGLDFSDVVDLTVYLTDVPNDFYPVGKVAQEYIGNPPPVMTLIGVKALALPELRVEIRAIAVK